MRGDAETLRGFPSRFISLLGSIIAAWVTRPAFLRLCLKPGSGLEFA